MHKGGILVFSKKSGDTHPQITVVPVLYSVPWRTAVALLLYSHVYKALLFPGLRYLRTDLWRLCVLWSSQPL